MAAKFRCQEVIWGVICVARVYVNSHFGGFGGDGDNIIIALAAHKQKNNFTFH